MSQRNQKQKQKPARASSDAVDQQTTNTNTTEKTMSDTTNAIQMIPLSQLHLSSRNVRNRKSRNTKGAKHVQLVASIRAAGFNLIQNLVVVVEANPEHPEKQGFGVVAGGRRLLALSELAAANEIGADHLIPCLEISDKEATEVSLVENFQREDMHPADEYVAFAKLVDEEGLTAREIAARQGMKLDKVRQRLSLGRLAPAVLELYREEELSSEQAMALTLTDSHERQVEIATAKSVPAAWRIKELLTDEAVRGDDVRAKFVGRKAYEKAGGAVRCDLFDTRSCGVYFESSEILNQLALAKLEEVAAPLRESLAWVEVVPGILTYAMQDDFQRVPTITLPADEETKARMDALQAQIDDAEQRIEQAWDAAGDEDEDAAEATVSAIGAEQDGYQNELDALKRGLRVRHPDAAPLVGAVVCLTREGEVTVLEDRIRNCDLGKLTKQDGEGSDGAARKPATASKEPTSVRGDMAVFYTAAMQDALAANPSIALRVLAYTMALPLIHKWWGKSGCKVACTDHQLRNGSDCPSFGGSALEAALEARHAAWEEQLPNDEESLWGWCLTADDATIQSLIAYATARSFRAYPDDVKNLGPVADALGVNMVDHWKPNAAYFNRLKRSDTLEVLAEQGHADPALAKLKRTELAGRAESLLAGSGWLAFGLRS